MVFVKNQINPNRTEVSNINSKYTLSKNGQPMDITTTGRPYVCILYEGWVAWHPIWQHY